MQAVIPPGMTAMSSAWPAGPLIALNDAMIVDGTFTNSALEWIAGQRALRGFHKIDANHAFKASLVTPNATMANAINTLSDVLEREGSRDVSRRAD